MHVTLKDLHSGRTERAENVRDVASDFAEVDGERVPVWRLTFRDGDAVFPQEHYRVERVTSDIIKLVKL